MHINSVNDCFSAVHVKRWYIMVVQLYCYAEPNQTWNYVKVRRHAYMFWWLYYTTAEKGYTSRPIVIWLQVCVLMTV